MISRTEADALLQKFNDAINHADKIVAEMIEKEVWRAYDISAASFFRINLSGWRPSNDDMRVLVGIVLVDNPSARSTYSSPVAMKVADECIRRGFTTNLNKAEIGVESMRIRRDFKKAEAAKKPEPKEEVKKPEKRWHPIVDRIASGSCSKYGSVDYLTRILESQGGAICAICQRPEAEVDGLSVDHDHGSNRARGFLCNNCNTGIGLLGEDSSRLAQAMVYVNKASLLRAMV